MYLINNFSIPNWVCSTVLYTPHILMYDAEDATVFQEEQLTFSGICWIESRTWTGTREKKPTIRTACTVDVVIPFLPKSVQYCTHVIYDQLIPPPPNSTPPTSHLPLYLAYEREVMLYTTACCTIWPDQKGRHCLLFLTDLLSSTGWLQIVFQNYLVFESFTNRSDKMVLELL